MPYLMVIGMTDQQGLNHGEAAVASLLRLFYDIRNETIAQVPPTFYDRSDSWIMPRFALAGAMIADVGGEDAKLRPSYIDLLIER